MSYDFKHSNDGNWFVEGEEVSNPLFNANAPMVTSLVDSTHKVAINFGFIGRGGSVVLDPVDAEQFASQIRRHANVARASEQKAKAAGRIKQLENAIIGKQAKVERELHSINDKLAEIRRLEGGQ